MLVSEVSFPQSLKVSFPPVSQQGEAIIISTWPHVEITFTVDLKKYQIIEMENKNIYVEYCHG